MPGSNAKRAWLAMLNDIALPVHTRIAERLEKGERPPSITLPASKADFPKVLCLDMNKWIELAKVHYKRDQTAGTVAALDAIRRGTGSGRLVVPITAPNLDEATQSSDEGQRTRLARFMVDLSGNFSCLNHVVVRRHEIDRAVEKHLLGTVTLPPIRPTLIHWGLDAAGIGREARIRHPDKEQELIARYFVKEPEMSVASLVHAMDLETHQKMRAREQEGLRVIEAVRKNDGHLTPAERRPAEMLNVLTSGGYVTRVLTNLVVRGISPEAYADLVTDEQRRLRFADDIPELHIWSTIMFERDRNPQDRSKIGDGRDGSFLSESIAYANVVVTENRWAHLANKTEVAKQYNTVVFASLAELPAVLAREGCA